MFDPKKCARVAASDFIAEQGWTAYRAKTAGLGITSLRDMSDDDALKLCKALGRGAMFASAKASGETPKAKTTAQSLDDLATEIYGKRSGGGPGPKQPHDPEPADDTELNPHRAVQTDEAPGEIDPTTIFAKYNKIDDKTKQARAQGVKPE